MISRGPWRVSSKRGCVLEISIRMELASEGIRLVGCREMGDEVVSLIS